MDLSSPLVLDGGLSNELAARGHGAGGELWTAGLLVADPAAIGAAHAAYVRAGADVLITASYQASFAGFARRGVERAAAGRLFGDSVRLARAAADAAAADGRRVLVAGSVGPYGAVLADGSEYRGRYGLSVAELVAFHRPRIEALAAAGPDLLALETVPDAVEAEALLRAAEGCGVPVWLSYTVAGGRTRAGQPLADAFALAAGDDRVLAVGVNCCDPDEVSPAVEIAAATTGKPVVAYPNSGEEWDAAGRRWRGTARWAAASALAWRDAGARLIGGCCRVGPERIAELATVLGDPR
ncbi:homocysteine S-methyltransferase [Streptomyces hainanensis]|uniref:Homocysteine S-methyltransferase n=1 Tax=Streptomyces hainanensis TaxID=402648 RepID=A0A4R4TEM9_9ACTN|nr:homocysteine S-methyltransferase [Streptomyces hainanensis]TDC72789.1 homocysteine S-methyltransferase [Streptomyces hainanensis]